MAVNIHWRPDEVPSLSLGAKPARCSDHSGAVTAECTNHYYTLLTMDRATPSRHVDYRAVPNAECYQRETVVVDS